MLVGFLIGWWHLPPSDIRLAQILFIGTALAISAVPVAVKVLMDLGKLVSTTGKMIVSAAIVDDIHDAMMVFNRQSLRHRRPRPGVRSEWPYR